MIQIKAEAYFITRIVKRFHIYIFRGKTPTSRGLKKTCCFISRCSTFFGNYSKYEGNFAYITYSLFFCFFFKKLRA